MCLFLSSSAREFLLVIIYTVPSKPKFRSHKPVTSYFAPETMLADTWVCLPEAFLARHCSHRGGGPLCVPPVHSLSFLGGPTWTRVCPSDPRDGPFDSRAAASPREPWLGECDDGLVATCPVRSGHPAALPPHAARVPPLHERSLRVCVLLGYMFHFSEEFTKIINVGLNA